MKGKMYRLPTFRRWIIGRLIRRSIREAALEDFEGKYSFLAKNRGKLCAYSWYWFQVMVLLYSFLFDMMTWGGVMFFHYSKIAMRKFRRERGYSFINISGLAVGMACFILILLWVQDELSYDQYHENAGALYRVLEEHVYSNGQVLHAAVTPAPLAHELKEELPEIVDATRYFATPRLLIRKDDILYYEERVGLADPSIFEMFTIPFIKGDPKTALSQLFSIVITEDMASKYFGDEDPIGKMLRVENIFNLRVTGVIENMPHHSHLQFDFLIPFIILRPVGEDLDTWINNTYYTYIQLAPDVKKEDVEKKMVGIIKKHVPNSIITLFLQPVTGIHLHSDTEGDIDGHGDIRTVYIFTLIAFSILFIACINFMNLATARSGNRAKEIGVRKVTGARRHDIIRQVLGESVLFSYSALLIALIVVSLFLPSFNHLTGKELSFNISANLTLVFMLIGIALLTGVLAGSYPALLLSSFHPVKILKGPAAGGVKGAAFRRTLVIFQFTLSITLLIATTIIHHQLRFMSNRKLGLDSENIVYIRLGGNPGGYYEQLKSRLLKHSDVLSVTAASELPMSMINSISALEWPGKDHDEIVLMHQLSVDYDYFETFKMEMVEGRVFSRNYATDASEAYIVNEVAAEIMGDESPVGKPFTVLENRGSIIGVVKNFHFRSLNYEIAPLFIRHFIPSNFAFMMIRIRGENIHRTINFLEKTWKVFTSDYPFEFRFLKADFDELYRSERRMGRLFDYFTALTIIIGCLGLFGLAVFLAQQRTKEIGIRKALGASVPGIVTLLSKEFIKWVLIANVIAWPLAYFASTHWLQNFAYRVRIDIWTFVNSAVAALLIALLTVSFQSVKAARANPVDSLRYE